MLALALSAMALVGCGNDGYGNPPDLAYDAGVADSHKYMLDGQGGNDEVDQTADTEGVPPSSQSNAEDETLPSEQNDTNAGDADTEIVSETGKAEGIIILQADCKSNSFAPTFVVSAVDPQTGDYHTVSSFVFKHVARAQEKEFLVEPAYELSRYSNYRDLFNEDFTLMAATKTFLGNEETHAGWVDQTGEFFDLTVALNEQAQSDFDTAKHFEAVGFTQDGGFAYADLEDPHNPIYYMVSLDNITPGASYQAEAGNSYIMNFRDGAWKWTRGYYQTCWVSDDQFLAVNRSDEAMLCACMTISSQSIVEIVPTGSQTSWSPVLGPDGSSVAFCSAPVKGTENPTIYLTDISGNGTPIAVETSYSPLCGRVAEHGRVLYCISLGYYYTSILEWR